MWKSKIFSLNRRLHTCVCGGRLNVQHRMFMMEKLLCTSLLNLATGKSSSSYVDDDDANVERTFSNVSSTSSSSSLGKRKQPSLFLSIHPSCAPHSTAVAEREEEEGRQHFPSYESKARENLYLWVGVYFIWLGATWSKNKILMFYVFPTHITRKTI